MNNNRDLLVLCKSRLKGTENMEHEVLMLHELLYSVEQLGNFIKTHEIVDLHRYKIVRDANSIRRFVRVEKEQAFVFLFNRN